MLDFMGIGAQKAGTTWLFEQLKRSPEIAFSEHKEVHFWDMHYERGLAWYQALFPDRPGVKWGDITPAYAILSPQRIAEINKIFPNLRLIYLMRNPIDRAWSAALMALKRAELSIEEVSDQWFIDHFHSEGSRRRGDYQACIDHWLSYYPETQLWCGRYDDIALDPCGLLASCAQHIGISTKFIDQIPNDALQEKVYAGPGYLLRDSLRPVLEDLYQNSIWFKK